MLSIAAWPAEVLGTDHEFLCIIGNTAMEPNEDGVTPGGARCWAGVSGYAFIASGMTLPHTGMPRRIHILANNLNTPPTSCALSLSQ
jgi:hypothetical protein